MNATKAKLNENYIELKNFCPAKEIVNRMKRQPTNWKKVFGRKYL